MDTLTHLVSGALIGEVILGRRIGKKAMLWGAIAANLPDVDVVNGFFMNDVDTVVTHRGITHSILAAAIAGPLLGWLAWVWHQRKPDLFSWILLFGVNLAGHLFLDTCTVYGTGLLEPFSDHRFMFDNIFVADPLFTLPLLLAAIALLVMRSAAPARKGWLGFGFVLSGLYLALSFRNHAAASEAFNQSLNRAGIHTDEMHISPTLLNNVLWQGMARGDGGTWLGYYSIFDGSELPEIYFVQTGDSLLSNLDDQDQVRKLKDFAGDFYCVTRKDSMLLFNIIRFGQIGGWSDPAAPFAFAFDLSPNADNSMVVQKGRVEGTRKEVLEGMWHRMFHPPGH